MLKFPRLQKFTSQIGDPMYERVFEIEIQIFFDNFGLDWYTESQHKRESHQLEIMDKNKIAAKKL